MDVAAGFYFTIVMTEHEGQRKLYGFGQNDVSQIAGKNTDEKEPALIEGINANHVVSFACSGFHSFFVTCLYYNYWCSNIWFFKSMVKFMLLEEIAMKTVYPHVFPKIL